MAPTFSIAEFHPGSFCVFRGDVPAAALVGRRKKVPITRFFGAIPAGIEFPQWAINTAGRAEFIDRVILEMQLGGFPPALCETE